MSGKLRENGIGGVQQFAGTGQIGHIGIAFAGIHRVAFQAIHLGALDFAVPVSAFNQADH